VLTKQGLLGPTRKERICEEKRWWTGENRDATALKQRCQALYKVVLDIKGGGLFNTTCPARPGSTS
jgi:hypothetical protein